MVRIKLTKVMDFLVSVFVISSIIFLTFMMVLFVYGLIEDSVKRREADKLRMEKLEMLKEEVSHATMECMLFEVEVERFIKSCNIKHPDIVLAQARIESGNFTSQLFLKYNNMFGMRHPGVRPTTSTGKNDMGYATYDNWKDSVYDYALWQVYCGKGKSRKEYIKLLADTYAEDTTYIHKIKVIVNGKE